MPVARGQITRPTRLRFASPRALTDALHSPVRIAMREDYHTFPPTLNGNKHYPMLTDVVLPEA